MLHVWRGQQICTQPEGGMQGIQGAETAGGCRLTACRVGVVAAYGGDLAQDYPEASFNYVGTKTLTMTTALQNVICSRVNWAVL